MKLIVSIDIIGIDPAIHRAQLQYGKYIYCYQL